MSANYEKRGSVKKIFKICKGADQMEFFAYSENGQDLDKVKM